MIDKTLSAVINSLQMLDLCLSCRW